MTIVYSPNSEKKSGRGACACGPWVIGWAADLSSVKLMSSGNSSAAGASSVNVRKSGTSAVAFSTALDAGADAMLCFVVEHRGVLVVAGEMVASAAGAKRR